MAITVSEGDAVHYVPMLHVVTGYSNNTLSCSELNGEHAGEGFRSIRHILMVLCRYERVKPDNVIFRENLTFDLT